MTDEEIYKCKCRVVAEFQYENPFAWERYKSLGVFDAELYGLNRFDWKDAVEGKIEGGPKLRRWTHKVAALIEKDPDAVMKAIGVSPKRREPKDLSNVGGIYQRMGITSGSPEELCTLAMQMAGDHGLSTSAGTLLREAFQKEARTHLDSAMILLPTLIYIGYRYQKPREFKWTVDQVLLSIDQRKPGSPCNPVIHSLCMAQLACAFSEGLDRKRAMDAFHDEGVRDLIDSSTEIPWFRPQLLRGRAAFYAIRGSNRPAAEKDLERCKEWDKEGNRRAIATIRHNIHMKESPPQFGKAWETIESFYDSGFKVLWAAMQKGRTDIRDLAHLFPSVYYGAMMRHFAKASRDKDDLAKDKMVLDWCYQRYGVMRLHDPDALADKYLLPKELCDIRDRCMRKPLGTDELATLDRLAVAIKEIPYRKSD